MTQAANSSNSPLQEADSTEFAKSHARQPMVAWFDPGQLLRTAGEVIVSSIIGRHADRRLIENLATQARFIDFTATQKEEDDDRARKEDWKKDEKPHRKPRHIEGAADELWIDYVADVGDGWNATYAVAYQLVKRNLAVREKTENGIEQGEPHNLKRGNILIFGGDTVYPTAHRDGYRERWELPYSEAFKNRPNDEARPFGFAIPGNHDWYDSLASFSEMFSGSFVKAFPEEADSESPNYKENQGGWRTPQNRSYFAIKLPHRWWLFGVDLQLNHDVDEAQLKYFKKVMNDEVKKDDGRVILCSPEPFWIYTEVFADIAEDYRKSRLFSLVKDVIGEQRIAVYLAGDLHHYYRVKDSDGVLRITAGGGGAFMHPTHGQEGQAFRSKQGYNVKEYPTQQKSKSLALWGNLRFLRNNPRFGLVTGTLYLLTAWFMLAGIGRVRRAQLVEDAGKVWESASGAIKIALGAGKTFWTGTLIDSPFLGFLCLAVVAGLIAFTDANAKRWFRGCAGLLHGLWHLASAGLIAWLGCVVFDRIWWVSEALRWPDWLGTSAAWLAAAFWVFLAGAIVGSCIMGIYLLVSLNLFGYHTGEGSSLKEQGYKNFLRLKIDAQGTLTIYPIGIDRVPCWSNKKTENEWQELSPGEANPSLFIPKNEKDKTIEPHLIEAPLTYSAK